MRDRAYTAPFMEQGTVILHHLRVVWNRGLCFIKLDKRKKVRLQEKPFLYEILDGSPEGDYVGYLVGDGQVKMAHAIELREKLKFENECIRGG